MVIVLPNQVPDPALPNAQGPPVPDPPVHIPDPPPPPPPIPPMHVPNPVQLQISQAHVPNPIQPQTPPVHVPNPMLPQAHPVQIPQLNWSYFKPEFSGKPEENAEAHLLRTNDWMDAHNFPEVAKVQRFV